MDEKPFTHTQSEGGNKERRKEGVKFNGCNLDEIHLGSVIKYNSINFWIQCGP